MADEDTASRLYGSMEDRTYDAVVALGTKVELYLASIDGVRADVRNHEGRLREVETRSKKTADELAVVRAARRRWEWTPLLLGCIAGVVSAIGYLLAVQH